MNETPGQFSFITRQQKLGQEAQSVVLRFVADVGPETVSTHCAELHTNDICSLNTKTEDTIAVLTIHKEWNFKHKWQKEARFRFSGT